MDYTKHYNLLIETRKNRSLPIGTYSETHHIIPKCMGGDDSPDNVVTLTAREHYVAHWLLYRAYPNNQGLAFSFWKMSIPDSKFLSRDLVISSRAYEEAKLAQSKAAHEHRMNVPVSDVSSWLNNNNRGRIVVNVKTGETFESGKKLWETRYSDSISYSGFNYYLRKRIKTTKPKKVEDVTIFDWKYKTNKKPTGNSRVNNSKPVRFGKKVYPSILQLWKSEFKGLISYTMLTKYFNGCEESARKLKHFGKLNLVSKCKLVEN